MLYDTTQDVTIDDPSEVAEIKAARNVIVKRSRSIEVSGVAESIAVYGTVAESIEVYGTGKAGRIAVSGTGKVGRIEVSGTGNIEVANGAVIDGVTIQPATPDEIRRLDQVRAALNGWLDMSSWHGDGWNPDAKPGDQCGTTHCLAGELQVQETDPALRRMDTLAFAKRVAPHASKMFYLPNEIVKKWLLEREYAK